ncbi:S1C family serine protease [Staphylococcus sp. 17KM0847]|uniref:S1C family serine protease n=1 Tax=Staphylococcus sp. 17KM0847 TaxID=2583989 RepID=UPI0015DD4F20|nr:S1C family serine protease [Staphylococcus sp. 17KM0847]QLK85669.1 trypsin-like serine protease [Staphylococcus sp. 17KM0847]
MDRDKKHVIPRRKYGRKRREFFRNEEREARIKAQQEADALKAEKEKAQAKNNEERVKDNLRKARIEKLTHEENKKTSKPTATSQLSKGVSKEYKERDPRDNKGLEHTSEEQPTTEQARVQQELYKQQASDIQKEQTVKYEKSKNNAQEQVHQTTQSHQRHHYTFKKDWTEKITKFVTREWAKILIVLGAVLILLLLWAIFHNVNQSGGGNRDMMQEAHHPAAKDQAFTQTMKNANEAIKSVVAVENNQEVTPETVQDATEQVQEKNESGSGVVYKKVGDTLYILTNAHVVGNKEKHELTYDNGKTVTGTVIGKDKWSDLAVLTVKASKVKKGKLVPFKQGDAEALILGEPVLVVGNPLGLDFQNTVGQGIVSGLERNVPIDIDKDSEYDMLIRAFQVDAPINPGDSGGAVVNKDGQLIGIASLKISMPNVEGMAFAIPINDAIKTAKKLEKDGEIKYPNTRVNLKDVATLSQAERDTYNIDKKVKEGTVVENIAQDSPVGDSGLKKGDVITELDGKKVKDKLVYRQQLFHHIDTDKPIKVKVLRGDEVKVISFNL